MKNNRLYIHITGEITKKEIEKVYTEVRFCVADLQPGFNVIADYLESNLLQLEGTSTFRRLMNFLIKNEVGDVVRVINEDSLLYTQVTNLSLQICGYKPTYTTNVEEAEKILASFKKRNGLRFFDKALPFAEYTVNDDKSTNHTGQILNISINGCAIGSATFSPSMDSEITLSMKFNNPDQEFITSARVVRSNDHEFAVEFQEFEKDQQDQLLECLLQQLERDL